MIAKEERKTIESIRYFSRKEEIENHNFDACGQACSSMLNSVCKIPRVSLG